MGGAHCFEPGSPVPNIRTVELVRVLERLLHHSTRALGQREHKPQQRKVLFGVNDVAQVVVNFLVARVDDELARLLALLVLDQLLEHGDKLDLPCLADAPDRTHGHARQVLFV